MYNEEMMMQDDLGDYLDQVVAKNDDFLDTMKSVVVARRGATTNIEIMSCDMILGSLESILLADPELMSAAEKYFGSEKYRRLLLEDSAEYEEIPCC